MVKKDNDGGSHADKNVAENALRMVCWGRKNVLFFGSDQMVSGQHYCRG
ncbi:transposase [Enterobacter asburiae]|nr:transposase [Enterobacter asburiae]HDU8904455.1 transposase [Enterobacter ludwigii]